MIIIKELQTSTDWIKFEVDRDIKIVPRKDINDFLNNILRTEDIKLHFIDGTENILYSKDFNHRLTKEEKEVFRYKPLSHQVAAFNFVFKHKKMLLLDSMGLGR